MPMTELAPGDGSAEALAAAFTAAAPRGKAAAKVATVPGDSKPSMLLLLLGSAPARGSTGTVPCDRGMPASSMPARDVPAKSDAPPSAQPIDAAEALPAAKRAVTMVGGSLAAASITDATPPCDLSVAAASAATAASAPLVPIVPLRAVPAAPPAATAWFSWSRNASLASRSALASFSAAWRAAASCAHCLRSEAARSSWATSRCCNWEATSTGTPSSGVPDKGGHQS